MLVLFCKQWSCVCSVGETESFACYSSGWIESALRMLSARELLVDSLLLPCCMSSARGWLSSGCSSVLCVSVLAGDSGAVACVAAWWCSQLSCGQLSAASWCSLVYSFGSLSCGAVAVACLTLCYCSVVLCDSCNVVVVSGTALLGVHCIVCCVA